MKPPHSPLVPAKAGTQFLALDSRFRGNERSWLIVLCMIAAVLLGPVLALPDRADGNEIKIGKQYGLPYIQFVIMEDQGLIEKHAKAQGLTDGQRSAGPRRSTTVSSRARSMSAPS